MPKFEIHFLDVGPEKYGDSILIRHGAKTIFIDGGHPRDLKDRPGYPSLPTQLAQILGSSKPYEFSLLVVTHAHNDHIGCLPELVADGVISARKVYHADVALGWGDHQPNPAPDSNDDRNERLFAVLREGPGATLLAPDPDQAIIDAMQLKQRYGTMLQTLRSRGATLVACTGQEDRAALVAEFSAIGLQILGPTRRHLLTCADQLARVKRDAGEFAADALRRDGRLTERQLFQLLADGDGDEALQADMFGEGSALNDQSIVLALEFAGKKILLAGDMQFAAPEVNDLDPEMRALLTRVKAVGPYDIAKTSHHTSYNALNPEVLAALVPTGRPFWLVHCGGVKDDHHPEPSVLNLLRQLRKQRPDFTWLRTDRNGLVSFTIETNGTVRATKAKGRINTFTPNIDTLAAEPSATAEPTTTQLLRVPAPAPGDFVEVITRIPHSATRVTVSIAVEPGDPAGHALAKSEASHAPGADPAPVNYMLPSDRSLPRLLFVTDEAALGRKIQPANARRALEAIRAAGQRVWTGPSLAGLTAVAAADLVRPQLDGVEGVVLLGGADVVPSLRLDVLGPQLRPQLSAPEDDPDNFVVWSDDLYGDVDGDHMPELPVSRIADGGAPETLAAALAAGAHEARNRFGIRNAARPFAQAVFKALPGNQPLRASVPHRSADLRPRDAQADYVYFMLHGDDGDSRRFWGEDAGSIVEAFHADQVPPRFKGVVFTGCCWGALTTTRRALHFEPGEAVTCRTARDSIALRFLAAGAQAFIGCTGVHYSPGGAQPTSGGGPMHRAFFTRLLSGEPPARALFLAKQDCLKTVADGADDPEQLAIPLKIIRQYTCLGLGW